VDPESSGNALAAGPKPNRLCDRFLRSIALKHRSTLASPLPTARLNEVDRQTGFAHVKRATTLRPFSGFW
jgi:hypothetical protein